MGKKNLSSLMDGLMGNDKKQEPVKPVETVAAEITDEMRENLAAKRKVNVGRPAKGSSKEKSTDIRATFIGDAELLRKLKYISLVEGTLLKDVIAASMEAYITAWEAENGKIRLPKAKA